MTSILSTISKIAKGLTVSLALAQMGFGQNLTGPVNVAPGSTATYTYDDGMSYVAPNWALVNGSQVSTSSVGTSYSVVVQWGSAGSGSVTFKNMRAVKGTLNVTIAASNGPSDENYVHTVVPRIAATSTASLSDSEKSETIVYYDGLGRAKQQIAIRGGGDGEDIITHVEYDPYGRQAREYLPYTDTSDGGSFRSGAKSATLSYYDATAFDADFTGMTTVDINPYSEKLLEASQLSRVDRQAAPGKDWKLGNGHEIEFAYLANTASEVRRYEVSLALSVVNSVATYVPTLVLDTGVNGGYYPANTLAKTVTRDENHSGTTKNNTVEEFTDRLGRTILKRTYATVSGTPTAHDTYYVYDIYGNLSFVLSPLSDPQSGKPDGTELGELCYQYRYDHRNRLVEKKVPGKGWEYIVYNKRDQPILTQDAVQRGQDKWYFTKYDAFGRVAYTGEMARNAARTVVQNEANGTSTEYVAKSGTATTIDGTTIYYNNGAYPTADITDILTINYYDNYTFDKVAGSSETAYGVTPVTDAKGLPTGSKVRVLGTNDWITNVTYYDTKARPIYQYSHNATFAATDKVKHQLDFIGQVLKTGTSHARTGFSTITTEDVFTYDHMGRLVKQTQAINGAFAPEVIAENTYDDRGQLVQKGIGGQTAQRLQTVDYGYNVRGWLKRINDPSSLGTDLFAFGINYNTAAHSGTALYNGNIAETEWRTANTDSNLKWYRYSYDALNRITGAVANSANYNLTSVAYDKNGNITALSRKGHTNAGATTFGNMDVLAYTYETSSNRLKKVTDTGNATYGFVDGSNIATEYTYDANGNMLRDYNKGITSNIAYNHLNLPTQVTLSGGNIQYLYDATGTKLRKTVSTGGTTEYVGNYVYENGSLKFFNHPEGYVEPAGKGSYLYVYQYKDHLGNIRLSYRKDGSALQVLEENNYYPFGLKHRGYNSNVSANVNSAARKYMFGGKEFNDELGLDWYDVSARNYDPALGRWMNLDPLAEKFVETSPYVYAKNNPVFFMDPNGGEPVPGPFTGAGWKSSNGTITVHRITAGQRYALNIMYTTAVTFSGGVGTAVGTYDSVKHIADINETTQTRVGVATQVALDGASSFLLTDAAAQGFGEATNAAGEVLDNAGNIKTLAKTVKGGLGGIGIAAAVMSDSDNSRHELISKWTFEVGESLIPGGNINYVQPGLFDVRDKNSTVEGVESRLNAIYGSISLFLNDTDFDLSTEDGQAAAAEYITANAEYVASVASYIYNYYNNKTEDED